MKLRLPAMVVYTQWGAWELHIKPWRVDSFDPTRGAELSANPHWWGGTVPIKRITLKLFADETSLALAMRAGEVDLDPYILDTKSFASASGVRLLSSPSCALGVFGMNTKAGPWSDVHVRRAAAYALNRPDIIAAAAGSNSPIYTYIGLYLEDTSIALSGKFTVPGFAQHYWQFSSNAYALDVKPAA